MILIIDSNIVMSGLIKDGLTRQFLINSPFTLYAPETLISEIRKYEKTIVDKSGLPKEDFEILFDLLIENIEIVDKEKYFDKIEEADQLLGNVDKNDIPFIDLALSTANDGIWSYD